jgi:2,4-dienoyl-CoA reductase-like NADH-dependent reductase (Old Yellow Enzyme family)
MTTLRRRIEQLVETGRLTATMLGREALRDPRFVHDLRRGRRPRPETEARVHAWLDDAEKRDGGEACAR